MYGTANHGKFSGNILDKTLGITLKSGEVDTHGSAIKNNFVTQYEKIIGQDASNETMAETGVTDSAIRSQVFYQRQLTDSKSISQTTVTGTTAAALGGYMADMDPLKTLSPAVNGPIDNTQSTVPVKLETFIRSQYASLAQAEIGKKYNAKNSLLFPDDVIEVEISLKNTSAQEMKNIVYLDTIAKIFARDNTEKYSVEINGQKIEKYFEEPDSGDYDLQFSIDSIPANSEAKIRYTLKVLPASYGEMLVGDFEK